MSEIEGLKKENSYLVDLLEDCLINLEHFLPPRPDHICGDPNACCDCSCAEYYQASLQIGKIKMAIKKNKNNCKIKKNISEFEKQKQ